MELTSRPIYCDIDGTLTDDGARPGNALPERIARIKALISEGKSVIVWSARGTNYAREFCARHGIQALAIGKPSLCIDDNAKLFGPSTTIVLAREYFD